MLKAINRRNYIIMEEKRFKILKKESYEEKAKKEGKSATISAILAGVTSVLVVMTASNITSMSIATASDALLTLVALGSSAATAGLSATYLKETVDSLLKKSMYESRIEDINSELEMLEQNESRGMRR